MINKLDDKDQFSLIFSVDSKDSNFFYKFLKSDSLDINQLNPHGQTAFHFAIINGELNKIKALVNYNGVNGKANLNQVDNKGRSALHIIYMTSHSNKKEIIQYLISNGANPDLFDKHSNKPSFYLSDKELKANLDPSSALALAAILGRFKIIQLLLTKGKYY